MGASRYVGRVGGLAVALGAGVAIFTGNGIAYADTATPDQSSTAAEDTDSGATAEHPKIRIKLSRPDGMLGRKPLESVADAVDSLKTVASDGAAARRSSTIKHSGDIASTEDGSVSAALRAARNRSTRSSPGSWCGASRTTRNPT